MAERRFMPDLGLHTGHAEAAAVRNRVSVLTFAGIAVSQPVAHITRFEKLRYLTPQEGARRHHTAEGNGT